jgi:hypothetical protein
MATRRGLLGGIIAVVISGAPASAQPGSSPLAAPEVIPGQFIVELKPAVGPDAVIREHGLAPFFRYGIIPGFAAKMPKGLANRLAADPRVRVVSPDLVVRAFNRPLRSRRGGAAARVDGSRCPDPLPAMPVLMP